SYSGKYITLRANGAVEAGYRYEGDKHNMIARLLAVPIQDKWLLVQVPSNHTGSSFTGTVTEMPLDVDLAILEKSTSKSLEDAHERFKKAIKVQPGPDGISLRPELAPPASSLHEVILPIFLDTTDQNFGLWVFMGILAGGFALAGLVTLIRAIRARGVL